METVLDYANALIAYLAHNGQHAPLNETIASLYPDLEQREAALNDLDDRILSLTQSYIIYVGSTTKLLKAWNVNVDDAVKKHALKLAVDHHRIARIGKASGKAIVLLSSTPIEASSAGTDGLPFDVLSEAFFKGVTSIVKDRDELKTQLTQTEKTLSRLEERLSAVENITWS